MAVFNKLNISFAAHRNCCRHEPFLMANGTFKVTDMYILLASISSLNLAQMQNQRKSRKKRASYVKIRDNYSNYVNFNSLCWLFLVFFLLRLMWAIFEWKCKSKCNAYSTNAFCSYFFHKSGHKCSFFQTFLSSVWLVNVYTCINRSIFCCNLYFV